MFNLSEIVAQIPINVYVLVGCLVAGWLMKKFLPRITNLFRWRW